MGIPKSGERYNILLFGGAKYALVAVGYLHGGHYIFYGYA
jgi:hypothetical protein